MRQPHALIHHYLLPLFPSWFHFFVQHLHLNFLPFRKGMDPKSQFGRQKSILSDADVVCATCSGADHPLIQHLTFARVLLDEAAQATELSTLVPLMKMKAEACVTLVGDHRQLPPTISNIPSGCGRLWNFTLWTNGRSRGSSIPPQRPVSDASVHLRFPIFYAAQFKLNMQNSQQFHSVWCWYARICMDMPIMCRNLLKGVQTCSKGEDAVHQDLQFWDHSTLVFGACASSLRACCTQYDVIRLHQPDYISINKIQYQVTHPPFSPGWNRTTLTYYYLFFLFTVTVN